MKIILAWKLVVFETLRRFTEKPYKPMKKTFLGLFQHFKKLVPSKFHVNIL